MQHLLDEEIAARIETAEHYVNVRAGKAWGDTEAVYDLIKYPIAETIDALAPIAKRCRTLRAERDAMQRTYIRESSDVTVARTRARTWIASLDAKVQLATAIARRRRDPRADALKTLFDWRAVESTSANRTIVDRFLALLQQNRITAAEISLSDAFFEEGRQIEADLSREVAEQAQAGQAREALTDALHAALDDLGLFLVEIDAATVSATIANNGVAPPGMTMTRLLGAAGKAGPSADAAALPPIEPEDEG